MAIPLRLAVATLLVFGVQAAPPPLHTLFNSQQCYAYTAQVAGFGERPPGSPGHQKTEDLIKQVLKKDGAQIEGDDFTATTPRGPIAVHNIIGKFNVTTDPKQPIFILAGHYDTLFKTGFIGANDGASSTAMILSFADALAQQAQQAKTQPQTKMKMQIWLMWTDLEESITSAFDANDPGLYGSAHYAQKLKAQGLVPRIKGFFLLDMIGDKDLSVARETASSTRWLQDFIAQAAKQLGYSKYFFTHDTGIIDDHKSFMDVGIPSVDVVDAEFGRMGPGLDAMGEFHHANTDTMDKVSRTSLEIVGTTILLTVELLDKQ